MNSLSTAQRALLLALAWTSALPAQACLIAVTPDSSGSNMSMVHAVETQAFSTASLATVNTPELRGLSTQPGTGDLFASGGFSSNGVLYRIDRDTGALTTVGPTGFVQVNGLAFGPDGTLYGAAENTTFAEVDTLIQINPMTGAGTVVGLFGVSGMNAIAFNHQTNTFYGITDQDEAYIINRSTGATTLEATVTGLTSGPVLGMAVDCAGSGFGSTAGGDLVEVSLADFATTVLGQISTDEVSDIAVLRSPNVASGCGAAGGTICDRNVPRIGVTWDVQPLFLGTGGCPGDNNFMLIGVCNPAGLSIGSLACASCATCALNVNPIIATAGFNAFGFQLPIPNNPGIVGMNLCFQNACLNTQAACLCMSNTLSMTIR